MFMIKTAEFLAHDLPLSDLKQEDMIMYRQKMTTELYRHGALKLHTRGNVNVEAT